MTATVGIVGVGHIAGYLVEGLMRGTDPPTIVLSPRGREQSARLGGRFALAVAADNREVVERSNLVILATRPKQAIEAATGLPWSEKHVLISVAAGISLAALRRVAAPATCMRAMPISCAAIGESPTPIFPDVPSARALFARVGTVHAMPDEAAFDAASVLGASYGWVHALIQETADWTAAAGVPEAAARALVAEMVRGAAGMVLARPDLDLAQMIATLATPGGITARGLEVLEDREAWAAWQAALATALARIRET